MVDDPWTRAYLERKAKAVFGTLEEESVARDWKPWFAWYPVAFGPHIAWFKSIERAGHNGEWYYRLTEKDRQAYVAKMEEKVAEARREQLLDSIDSSVTLLKQVRKDYDS